MRLRLASYNIRKSVGLDWQRDPARSIRVINQLEADVVALQEVDRRLKPRHAVLDADMILRETDLRPVPLGGSPVSLGWHGNALLVRKDLEVTETALIELPGIEPRGGVTVSLPTEFGPLTLVGVHLGLRRGCRRLQLARILDHLDPEMRPLSAIMGDFNEWSGRRGTEALGDGFRLVTPGRSFHAARPLACLDRFALGPGLRLLDSGVERGAEARIASDHLPVWADLLVEAAAEARPATARAG